MHTGKTTDILIVGGGIPGLTLSVLLAGIGVNVALVDTQAPVPTHNANDSRTSALMAGSVNILKATQVWDECAPYGSIITGLSIIDDNGKKDPVQVTFHSTDIGQDYFAYNMPNHMTRNALLARAATLPSLTIYAPAKLQNYTADAFGISAQFEGAPDIRARLIIGADGRASTTRAQAGIDVWERDYGQRAITCLISHTLPHNNISTEFHRPGGPFTLVPLTGNRSSIVWVDFADKVDDFIRMNKSVCQQALQDRSRGILGEITLETSLQSWPLHALKAKSFTASRTALIAEAAHVLHPLGAQGLNLSLRDAASLAEILADGLRLGQDPGSQALLHAYEIQRQQDVNLRVLGTDTLTRMVSNNIPVLRNMRRLGLKTLETISPLRDMIMREGMAPQKAGSRLALGKAL